MRSMLALLFLIAIYISPIDIIAKSAWVNQIPNGSKDKCSGCHNSPNGGSINPFGKTVKNGYIDSKGKVAWSANLASIDSDADGYSNGAELQDPQGIWKIGSANPGELDKVTNPGDKSSFPTSSSVYDADAIPSFAEISKLDVFPNPVANSSNLSITTKDFAPLTIDCYRTDGSFVFSLYQGYSSPGNKIFNLNPAAFNLSNGMYIIRASSGNTTIIKKISVLR